MQIPANAVIGIPRSAIAAALQSIGSTCVVDDFVQSLMDAGAQPLFTPPPIGEYWPGQGGVYAGQVREDDGTCYHQILADSKPIGRLDHAAATKWAASLAIDGHSDFVLPTQRGAALLYANLSHLFEKVWHWTSTNYSESCAWVCLFDDGYQGNDHEDDGTAARAVRRFKV